LSENNSDNKKMLIQVVGDSAEIESIANPDGGGGILLDRIILGSKPLSECSLYAEYPEAGYRLYFLPNEGPKNSKNGFHALAIKFISDTVVTEEPYVEGEMVEVLFIVNAHWDGVRHFNIEYINSPNLPGMIELLSKVHELQLKYCSDYDI